MQAECRAQFKEVEGGTTSLRPSQSQDRVTWQQLDPVFGPPDRQAGVQGSRGREPTAREPGLGRGLVYTDATEQVLARCLAFWGEAGNRRPVAGWKVSAVCLHALLHPHPHPQCQ